MNYIKIYFKRRKKQDTKPKLCTEKQWIKHLKELERLSEPKPTFCSLCPPSRGRKVPLRKLCTRINCLSQPRKPLKKREYVKDPNEFSLPGKIKDWKAHCQWLERNSLPKEISNPDCYQVNDFLMISISNF